MKIDHPSATHPAPLRTKLLVPAVVILGLTAGAAGTDFCATEWDGSVGQPGINSSVRSMTSIDKGGTNLLFIGGDFIDVNGVAANRVASWDGETWAPVGAGTNGIVLAMTFFDEGNGPQLFIGGNFNNSGGKLVRSIARWEGDEWVMPSTGIAGDVRALTVFDDGNGSALYVGGNYTAAGGNITNGIARWDGETFTDLGTGLTESNEWIESLVAFDDGSGTALYAAGRISIIDGVEANNIARWDGESWSALGEGVNGDVFAMAVYDDGTGPALYVGGTFTEAGGKPASRIARWDGRSWSTVGLGLTGGLLGVQALSTFDSGIPGNGTELYAGGSISSAGGVSVNRIARWNGTEWADVGGGVTGGPLPAVTSMYAHDIGTGPALYVGGTFQIAGGEPALRFARWRAIGEVEIISPPEDQTISQGETLTLTVEAAGADEYQWHNDGEPLVDDDRISGSQSPTLTIEPAMTQDSGEYDVVVANDCGPILSPPATVVVEAIPGDLTGDGTVGVADLLILINAWGPCADCDDCPADLTGDCTVGVPDLLILIGNWG